MCNICKLQRNIERRPNTVCVCVCSIPASDSDNSRWASAHNFHLLNFDVWLWSDDEWRSKRSFISVKSFCFFAIDFLYTQFIQSQCHWSVFFFFRSLLVKMESGSNWKNNEFLRNRGRDALVFITDAHRLVKEATITHTMEIHKCLYSEHIIYNFCIRAMMNNECFLTWFY